MYRVIESEMAFIGLSKKVLAEKIHMPYSTLLSKLNGRSDFTLDEALKLKDALGTKKALETLFDQNYHHI